MAMSTKETNGREVPEAIEPMLQSVSIKGFRGFEDITLASLNRINLITGNNNVGKTALLDALFIQLGPDKPELMLRTNLFRGIERFDLDPEEIWGSFFFNKHIDQPIEIMSRLTNNTQPVLKISLQTSKHAQLSTTNGVPAQLGYLSTTQTKRDVLAFEYEEAGETFMSSAVIDVDGTVHIDRAPVPNLRPGVFLAARNRSPDDATRFSKLERTGRSEEVTTIMRIIESRLRKLSVLVTGGIPLIHADINTGELIPIPLMGEGMVRMLSIVLSIMNYQGGTVLIDEIENGLHHSVLQQVWAAIAESARQNHVQVFATTHSRECIHAAHRAMENDDPYHFRLFRLEREDEAIRVVTYDKETIATSFDLNLEVR